MEGVLGKVIHIFECGGRGVEHEDGGMRLSTSEEGLEECRKDLHFTPFLLSYS